MNREKWDESKYNPSRYGPKLYAIGKVKLQKHQNELKKTPRHNFHINDFLNKCIVEHFHFDI